MKYNPCCGCRCLLGHCDTRDQGGCYCVCRLKDHEKSLQNILSGNYFRKNGGIIYEPGREKIPLEGEERESTLKELEEVRTRLKKYEIKEE